MAEFTKEQMAQIQSACAEAIAICSVPKELPYDLDVDEFLTHWWGLEPENLSVFDAIDNGMMSDFAFAVLKQFCN